MSHELWWNKNLGDLLPRHLLSSNQVASLGADSRWR